MSMRYGVHGRVELRYGVRSDGSGCVTVVGVVAFALDKARWV